MATSLLEGLNSGATYDVDYTRNGAAQSANNLVANSSGQVTISSLSAATYANIIVTDLNNCTSNTVGPSTLIDPAPSLQLASPIKCN